MKKLFSLLLLGFGLFIASQTVEAQVVTMDNSTDTVTNAGTVNLDATIKAYNPVVSFQVVATKISGTVAGTAILQASIDGTNYVSIGEDTLTLSNTTTNTHLWVIEPSPYLYYRIKVTGSGTMSARTSGYALPRKQQ